MHYRMRAASWGGAATAARAADRLRFATAQPLRCGPRGLHFCHVVRDVWHHVPLCDVAPAPAHAALSGRGWQLFLKPEHLGRNLLQLARRIGVMFARTPLSVPRYYVVPRTGV